MTIVYDKIKYSFRDGGWVSSDGTEVNDILSNFLCDKAISNGEDPGLFARIKTPVKTRTKFKNIISSNEKKNKDKIRGFEVLFKL